jgi:hypothetical protein
MAYDPEKPPVEEDIRSEDHEFNPAIEPDKALAWLNVLREAEDAFEDWNYHCDNIDKRFASLNYLAQGQSPVREKEFQVFWANCEVIKPAIYAKAPVAVVVPKFKDRRAVYQQASEVMERCCNVAFDLTRINDLMLLVRDDIAMSGRAVAWCRYESAKDGYYDSERVCIDFKGRRDFLHSISRNWREVTWVAAASYLTRSEARERFKEYSGDTYQEADYKVDKESKEIGGADNRERAKFWEIWHKGSRRVVWVSEGCEDILDEDEPHLELQNFFPCPKPAYGTVQRGSLIPVPDAMQYKDQLEEVNMLTGRIHALSDALQCKGFYPAGGEAAEAIQTAIAMNTPGQVIVPISNWSSFGNSKEAIMWLPIDILSTTITALVMLRKQVIDDIYQITGMADIMRGDTDPQETLGAQRLKSQYGSTRIRDKQQELVRLARDLVEITSEIITEKFSDKTIIEMSQTQLPQAKTQQQRIRQIEQQLGQLQQQIQMAQQTQVPPPDPTQNTQSLMKPSPQQQQMQQLEAQMQQGMAQIQTIQQEPTIEQVLQLLSDGRVKSFVLDIETDSTIMADENAEKAARTEFGTMMASLLPQLGQLVQSNPAYADFAGKFLKFMTAPYRAGRELDGAIDNLVELVEQNAQQGPPENPQTAQGKIALQIEQMKLTYAKQKDDADRQVKVADIQTRSQTTVQKNQIDAQAQATEVQGRQQEHNYKLMELNTQRQTDLQHHQMQLREAEMKMQMAAQKHAADMAQAATQAQQKASHFDQMAQDRRAQQQFKMTQLPPQRGGPV